MNPENLARKARITANISLSLSALSVAFLLAAFWGSGRLFEASTVWAVLAFLAGAFSVMVNRNVPLPRPAKPVVALIVGLVLAGLHALIWWLLQELSKNH